jgi:hypothetical protein
MISLSSGNGGATDLISPFCFQVEELWTQNFSTIAGDVRQERFLRLSGVPPSGDPPISPIAHACIGVYSRIIRFNAFLEH